MLHELAIERIDPRAWETMDVYLCRLAKRFKAAHGGRMMKVEVSVCDWKNVWNMERFRSEWPMPNLEKEAKVIVPKSVVCRGVGVWHHYHVPTFV